MSRGNPPRIRVKGGTKGDVKGNRDKVDLSV